MFRLPARYSRGIIVGALSVSLTAAAAVAGTIHTFAVSQTTGSEGAYDFLQTTNPGGALQGEVGSSASTGLGTPFGMFGKYGPSSGATKGIGAVGISTFGWGVVGENIGYGPALYAFPNNKDGVGLDAESDNTSAIYAVAHGGSPLIDAASITNEGNGLALDAYSVSGAGIVAEGGAGDGIDAYSDADTYGVFGQSNGGSGVSGSSITGTGVYGQSDNGFAVSAISMASPAPTPTGSPYQYAASYSQSISGPGAYGVNDHNVMAVGAGPFYTRFTGVFGSSTDGAGVYGYSKKDFGVLAESGGQQPALAIEFDGPSSSTDFELLAGSGGTFSSNAGFNFGVEANGDEIVGGTVFSGGGSFAVTRNPRSDAMTYGSESTEPMVEDVGNAHLIGGTAAVPLTADFRQTIQDASNYIVFLTPYGDTKGLYVASRTPAGFTVREAQGGRSTFDFAYRIVAQRYGVQTGRLPHLAAISPRMAQLRLAALHPNASAAYANTALKYAMVAPPMNERLKRAMLLAQARHASAASRRRMMRPPAPPPGFLSDVHH